MLELARRAVDDFRQRATKTTKTFRIAAAGFVLSILAALATYGLTSLIWYFDWYDGFGKHIYGVLHVAAYGVVLIGVLSLAVMLYIVVSGAIRNVQLRSR
jgi:hypothetical protein